MAIYNGGLNIIAPDTYSKNEINDLIADKTRSNLLRPIFKTVTRNGITCTNNGDGTYTINGTATANNNFILAHVGRMSGCRLVGCPAHSHGARTYLAILRNGTWTNVIQDFGLGAEVSLDTDDNSVIIAVEKGLTVNNLLFKPMITTDLSATYDDFVSYDDSFIMGINSGTNLDLLWEHANPNNGSNGSINLDLSGYKFIYIIALTGAGNTSYVDFLFKIDNMTHVMFYFDMYGMRRELTIKTNGIDVGDNLFFQNYGSAGSANNAGLVPYRIYGVK